MRIYSTHSALRLVAVTLFTVLVASCGQGDGPEPILDSGRDPGAAARQEGFEDPSAIAFGDFEGAVTQIINNPQKLAARGGLVAKPNLSDRVGEMRIGDRFSNFGGTTVTLPEEFGYADGEIIKIDVWASRPVQLLFILEGPGRQEVTLQHPGNSLWEELSADFTGLNPPKTDRVTLIFDPGVAVVGGNVQDNIFYFDNIFGGTDAQTSVVGGPGGGGGPATGGTVPEVVLIAADGSTPDLVAGVDYTGLTAFGSGSGFNASFTGDSSYDNALEITVGAGYGGGALAQIGVEGFSAGFASDYDELLFKAKGLTADNTIQVKLEEPFPGTSVPVTVNLASPGADVAVTDLGDGWSQVVIQTTAYGDVSTFSQIVFQTADGAYAEGAMFYLTDIGFNNGAGGPGGNLATNGDFEAGDLSGWTPAAGSGTIEAVDTQDSGSTWSGRLSTPMANGAALSQANLAAGTVAMGDLIDVSFDLCGTTDGDSGEVAIALLSEFGMGAGADRQDLQRFNQTNLPSVWTRYNLQGIAGSNVAGGVSLQFDAICGAVAGCGVELFVDNVVVTIGGGIVPGTASGQSCDGGGGGTPVSGAVFDDTVDSQWTESLLAFDQAIGFGECIDDGGAGCPSINWSVVAAADMARGDVVDVVYDGTTQFAGLVIGRTTSGLDFSQFAGGNVVFDLNVTSNPNGAPFLMKVDCVGCPTDAGQREQSLGVPAAGWQTFTIAVDDMVNANGGPMAGGLRLDQVTTGIVVFPGFGSSRENVTYQIDNIRWEAAPPPPSPGAVFDDTVDSQWTESLLAFDQAIGFGECIDDGGAGCPSINWSVVAAADMARGDVVDVVYDGTTQFAGLVIGRTTSGLDFSQFAGGNVVFDLNVTSNPNGAPFLMKVDCVGCPTDAGQREQSLGVPAAGWQTFTIAVDDMVNANGGPMAGGLRLDQVTTGIVVFPGFGSSRENVTYQIDNIRWEAGGGGGTGDELALNGDFETGDFTDWEQFINSGAQSISMDTPDASSFSGALSGNTAVGAGGTTEIKQTERGAGTLVLGDVLRIQFDVKGSFGPGGQLNVLSFTEQAVGATQNDNTVIAGGVDDWTPYDYMVTVAGDDVDRGFSLAFNAVCGAVAGCFADVLVDNVSIVKQ